MEETIQPTLGETMVEDIVSRTNKVIGKLENGAGKVETCPAHAALAEGIVCISKMTVPLYKTIVLKSLHEDDQPTIKSKWFTAHGYGAMMPVVVIFIVLSICYTVIKVTESNNNKGVTNVSSIQR